jgi:hypothetical protein
VQGKSIDGKGKFSFIPSMKPMGQAPLLASPRAEAHAQVKQEALGTRMKEKIRISNP